MSKINVSEFIRVLENYESAEDIKTLYALINVEGTTEGVNDYLCYKYGYNYRDSLRQNAENYLTENGITIE